MEMIHKLHQVLFTFGRTVEKSLQEELNITFPQFMILLAMSHHPECTQATIAEWRKLTPAAISKHIDSLLNKKYITRKTKKHDRREHSILMTAKGKILFKKAKIVFEKKQKDIFKKVPKSVIVQMNKTLDKLLQQMDVDQTLAFTKHI